MKFLVTLGLLNIFTLPSLAQTTITGRVKDQQGNPLPHANVLLLTPTDSSLIKGKVTSQQGTFKIENVVPGKYLINARFTGYVPDYHPLEIQHDTGMKNIGSLVLNDTASELEEVVVEGQKPLYEMQMDRMVVNVENSITSAGNTVLEILEKSPGVVVDRQNNSLSLNGKSDVAVMINGKISRMPTEAVVQMLNGMNGSNIEKIELITQPPAKYEAEGRAGIIHIITKKDENLGTHGNLGVTAGYNWAEILGGNLNLTHREKKWAAFLNYNINYDYNREVWKNYLAIEKSGFTSRVNSESIRKPYLTVQNLRAGLEFTLSGQTTLETMVTLYERDWTMKSHISTIHRVTPDSTILSEMSRDMMHLWQNININAGLNHHFNEKSILSLDFDYLYYHNNNPNLYDNNITYQESGQTSNEEINISRNIPIDFKIGKLDYTYEASEKFQLETGLKSSFSSFDNNVLVERKINNNIWREDPDFSNNSNMIEWIAAGYFSFQWGLPNNFHLNGGLRYEYTDTDITSPEQVLLVDRGYGNFFPNLILKRNLSENSDLQVGYYRRITRPKFDDLAPFMAFLNPNFFTKGNAALLPAIMDGFKIEYRIKQLFLSANYGFTDNMISGWQEEINKEEDTRIMRTQNLDYARDYSFNISCPFAPTDWWKIQSNIIPQYSQYRSAHLNNNKQEDIFGIDLNVVNNIRLPKGYNIEISGNYRSGAYSGLAQIEPFGAVNVGIQKEFNNNGGTLTLGVDDIFNTYNFKWINKLPDQDISAGSSIFTNSRSIKLTYTWSFGNKKLKEVKIESGSEEEQKRVGN